MADAVPMANWFTRACIRVAAKRDALSILALHRVRAEPDPLFPEELDARRFDRLVGHLVATHGVMPLGRALAAQVEGDLKPGTVAITFDDGYADNAEIALPILRKHGVQATFFVASGFLNGGLMWNDAVIESIRMCKRADLDLHPWGLGRVDLGADLNRRQAIERMLPTVKYMRLNEREEALRVLRDLCGSPQLPTDLMMRSAQVRELASAGMEIGAHTVAHPILALLAPDEAEREIAAGRDTLQALIGRPVDLFAFPNGVPGRDYRAENVRSLRRLGFRAAVTTAPGLASRGLDPLQLPRFTPWDRAHWRWSLRLLAARRLGVVALDVAG